MSTTEKSAPIAAARQKASPSKAEIHEARALAKEVGLEYIDLDRYPLNAAAASLLSETVARKHHALAVGWKYGTPVVAVARPDNVLAMDDIKAIVGRDIHAVVACTSQIDAYLDRVYVAGAAASSPAPTTPAAKEAPAAPPVAEKAAVPAPPTATPVTGSKAHGDTATPGGASHKADQAPAPPAASLPEPKQEATEPAEGHAVPAVADAHRTPSAEPPHAPAKPEAAPHVAERPASTSHARDKAANDRTETAKGDAVTPARPKPTSASKADTGVVDDLLAAASLDDSPDDHAGAEQNLEDSREKSAPALAEVLVTSGQVTREEMAAALREQAATGRSLGEILSELGLVSEEDLTEATASESGMAFVDLNDYQMNPEATKLIPESLARRHRVLAIGFKGDVPIIGMANPYDVFALDDLRTLIGREIITVVCSPGQVAEYLSRVYRHDQETSLAAQDAASQTSTADITQITELTDLHAVVEDAPIVKYVNLILRQALQERASDVHIEPTQDDLRIRFRIDGVLHDITRSPKAIQGGVTTRLKVMASLDIAEHRVPQDGRITLNAGRKEVDLRVATLPTVHGEKVVMRILDKSNASLELAELGFLPDVQTRYQLSYRKPYGTILVTGPTGSGKSTTLYATLNALNSSERNLITVEDPVEYQLRGVNQIQVNPKAGLTFANALRSILRADPDIILVGEIRDRETAVIGIEAALTGHLVLSSLHTNNAAGTPMRLIEMGVESFLVGSSLDCVLAQRLARQLCENCADSHDPSPEELELLGFGERDVPATGVVRFRKAVGCQACSRTGFRGRMALHELLIVDDEIERAVIARASNEEIQNLALEQGMVPLRNDGLRKAALGLTSIEEVLRVVA